MIAIGLLFVRMLCDCFKSRPRLEAEILVLRHHSTSAARSRLWEISPNKNSAERAFNNSPWSARRRRSGGGGIIAQMKRRAFITLLGRSRRAQQPGKVPTIGFLSSGTRATWALWVAAFVQRLRELGWTEGRTVAIEYRWVEGRSERFAEIAAEFIRLKVDVLGTPRIMLTRNA